MSRLIVFPILLVVAVLSVSANAFGLDQESAQDQASRLYRRLTGLQPSLSTLTTITDLMMNERADEVAFIAMSELNFYKSTLKMMFAPFSNRAGANDTFTDYEATIVGIVKDNVRFDEILYGDIIYTGNDAISTHAGTIVGQPLVRVQDNNNAPPAGFVRAIFRNDDNNGTPSIQWEDNAHYDDLRNITDWPDRLQRRTQSSFNPVLTDNDARIASEDISGVITLRQAAAEYMSAGTNRRVWKYLLETYFCGSLEEFKDSSVPDIRVSRDVVRSPGGHSENYLTCRGCHAGTDALRGAWLYFDFNGNRIHYDRTALQNNGYVKLRQYNNFPEGYRPVDNSWINFWASYGTNATRFGWQNPVGGGSITQGAGANSLGRVLAATRKFSSCMAERVFKQVCFRDPTPNESTELGVIASQFEAGMANYSGYNAANPYNLKALFAATSEMCFGHQ